MMMTKSRTPTYVLTRSNNTGNNISKQSSMMTLAVHSSEFVFSNWYRTNDHWYQQCWIHQPGKCQVIWYDALLRWILSMYLSSPLTLPPCKEALCFHNTVFLWYHDTYHTWYCQLGTLDVNCIKIDNFSTDYDILEIQY